MTIVKRQMGATNMTGSNFLKSGIIEKAIQQRIWTINDILNADEITVSIVDTLINDMDSSTKWDILKQSDLANDMSAHLRKELNSMVSFVLTNFLKTATVDFGGEKDVEETKEIESPDKRQVGTDTTSMVETEPKVMTLKERIRQDTKLMSEEEKKKAGMV
tara:strand:- start:433 stop:915 length:483 start_codon:yes stop_codon:yes gene_type:complete